MNGVVLKPDPLVKKRYYAKDGYVLVFSKSTLWLFNPRTLAFLETENRKDLEAMMERGAVKILTRARMGELAAEPETVAVPSGQEVRISEPIHVADVLLQTLRNLGCSIELDTPGKGIVTVTTPRGRKWDFTIPQEVMEAEEKIQEEKPEFEPWKRDNPPEILGGMTIMTVINLKHSEDAFLGYTYGGPANHLAVEDPGRGKFRGFITESGYGRAVVSTGPVFDTAEDAVAHMRRVVKACRAFDM